jgi:hypothetical protein
VITRAFTTSIRAFHRSRIRPLQTLTTTSGDPEKVFTHLTHQFTAYGKVLLTTRPVSPYLRLQTGMYRLGLDDPSYGAVNEFGLGGGIGVQWRSRHSVGFFADLIFHHIFTEDEATQILGIQAGLQYLF